MAGEKAILRPVWNFLHISFYLGPGSESTILWQSDGRGTPLGFWSLTLPSCLEKQFLITWHVGGLAHCSMCKAGLGKIQGRVLPNHLLTGFIFSLLHIKPYVWKTISYHQVFLELPKWAWSCLFSEDLRGGGPQESHLVTAGWRSERNSFCSFAIALCCDLCCIVWLPCSPLLVLWRAAHQVFLFWITDESSSSLD